MNEFYDYEEENVTSESFFPLKSRAEKRKISQRKKASFRKRGSIHKIKVHGNKAFVAKNYKNEKERAMEDYIHTKAKSTIREEVIKINKELHKENGEYVYPDEKYGKYEQYRRNSEPRYLFG